MRHGRLLAAGAVMVVCWLLAGCTNANRPLNDVKLPVEARRLNQTRAAVGTTVAQGEADHGARNDGWFVGVAISGGGSRSANFGAACMFQLQRLGLLQHCDYISSVSGGSLAAAYYCLSDDAQWNPADVQEKLTHPFATDLIVDLVQPWNLAALWATDWDRSDLLAGSFDRVLFRRAGRSLTYGDLRADRPRLLINATDMQNGRPFVFCNESFDRLNSDLSRYPVAYAVMASAAVPVLLHQVTLRDYSTVYHGYRHLIDGGINDNLGVQTLARVYDDQMQAAEEKHLPPPYPRGAILVVIDARTNFNARLSDKGDTGFFEFIATSAGLASTALVNRASSATMSEMIVKHAKGDETAAEMRRRIEELDKTGYVQTTDPAGRTVKVLHLSLGRVRQLNNLPFDSFYESLDDMQTYFNISHTEAYHLYTAADMLVRQKYEGVIREMVGDVEGK